MTPDEAGELESLRLEVRTLRGEGKTLREFVSAFYAMINEEEDGDYEADGSFRGGMEFGRLNT